ncbi:MAG: hypothetical protein GY906_34955 [bacterium]|nr:hypothetical protein [bacterium]
MRNLLTSAFVSTCLVVCGSTTSGHAQDEPWIITDAQIVTEPMEVGDIIVAEGGSLRVVDVPEPGFQISGHLWAIGESRVELVNSVIQFMSTYHGQYGLVSAENSSAEVTGCDYRVPNGVQHALVSHGNGDLQVTDTDFGFVQLLAMGDSRLVAERLNGDFEVLLMDQSSMVLNDIPRDPGSGQLWVWPEVTPGSEVVYSPPLPGFVDAWEYPPEGSTGIEQRVDLARCEVMLWPILVDADSKLTLRDITEDNWIVVGLLMPNSAVIRNLGGEGLVEDLQIPLHDRMIQLENASIDTWNLYPQAHAQVDIIDSILGEIISEQNSRVWVERCLIDGNGGWFGSREDSHMVVHDSVVTCTVEAGNQSTLEFHNSQILPYEVDPTGEFTRFGAFDDAILFAHQTTMETTAVLGGSGLIGVSFVAELPPSPPVTPFPLYGSAALFSLDPKVAEGSWMLESIEHPGTDAQVLAEGSENVESGLLATWANANPAQPSTLRLTLTDGLSRSLIGSRVVRSENGEPADGHARRPRKKKLRLPGSSSE